MNWYIGVATLLVIILFYILNNEENFVSGKENPTVKYDKIYPLDHPMYITPQQKDFQMVLSEHSSLDSNMQNIRPEIRTQQCELGAKCFNSREWHSLNYAGVSSPDVINTKIDPSDNTPKDVIYRDLATHPVEARNQFSGEMSADLFDNLMIPDLFFGKRKQIRTHNHSTLFA